MSLEREVASLQDTVDWPATPDLAARLALEPRRPRRGHRRRAVALVLVALAGAAAVPDVRAAVGRVLGVAGGERVERTSEPPRPAPRLDLGAAVSLEEARRRAGFRVAAPPGVTGVRVGGALGDRTLSLLLGPDAILSQRPGRAAPFATKEVPPAVGVDTERVGLDAAIWIDAGPRTLLVRRDDGTQARWAAALPGAGVLLWDRADGVAMRLETRGTRREALRLAASVP
jgi:hypothetical protein